MNETAKPTAMISMLPPGNSLRFLNASKANAPTIVGIASQNENSVAALLSAPNNMAPTIVAGAGHPRHHGEALYRADPQIHRQREFGRVVIAGLELEAIDPQQHEATGHKHCANDPDIEQHALDGPVSQSPDHHGRKEGD